MKYILIFLFALLCSIGYAQFPVNQYMGSQTTLVTARGGLKADSSLILPQFPDTTTANRSPYIKFYPGNLIRVFNDIYMRNTTATGWILVSSGGGSNNFIDSLKIISDSVYARKYGVFVYQYKTPTTDTTSLSNRINLKLNISDTAAMLAPYSIRINNKIDSLYKIGDSVFARKNGVFVFQYLDISQNILANNGLSFSGDTLQLGGTLTKNTTINADSNEVRIDTASKFIVTNALGLNHIYIDSTINRLNVKSAIPSEQNQLQLYLGDRIDYEPQRQSQINLSTTADDKSANLQLDNYEGISLSAFGGGNQSNFKLSRDSIAISPNDSIISISKIKTNADTANYLPLMWNPNVKRLEAYRGGFGNLGIDTTSLSNRINQKLNISDTAAMLAPYFEAIDTVNLRRVTSVGLTMPSAFNVAGSPITDSGTIAVTGAGTASQYVRGDGQLANFPSNGGGGSSVNYYLNGSVNQGTFGGDIYYQLSKVPIIGTGTNFTRTSAQGNGYIASFITDAGDPALLNIPGGNWNLEFYFNASSGGGNPSFYAEIYKVSATNVFTLIASGSTNPEGITQGTVIDQYFTSIPVPQTTLVATDRIAIRIFVTPSGRNITLHTEDNNLCEVLTTFSTGLNALNGLTAQVQYFATGTSGTDFNISSATDTHTFNLPTASATNRGALSSADWSTFNGKLNPSDTTSLSNRINLKLNISDTASMLAPYTRLNQLTNIYNTDGSLTSARTLTLNSQPLTIAGTTSSRFFANGNVGIGTTTDNNYKLNVNGRLWAGTSGSGNSGSIVISGLGDGDQFANFILDNGLTGASNRIWYHSFKTLNNRYAINYYNGSNYPEYLSIYNSGNILIGAGTSIFSDPGYKLDVVGTTRIQNKLSVGTPSATSAVMEITSTTQGFLQPRMTTSQMNAISTPATGLSVFNTTDSLEYVYRGTGSGWQKNVTYTRTNDIGLLNGADQRLMIEPTTNVVAGRALTVEAGSTQAGGTNAFQALSQTSRQWHGMAAASNGDIYAVASSGDIFRRTGGAGNFVGLGQTTRNWRGIAVAPNGDIYATAISTGDIFKSTGGGAFIALSAGNFTWAGICVAPNGDIYAAVQGGDIYRSTNGGTTFSALGQTSRTWVGMAAATNGDIYASVFSGDIYKQTGGTGNFIALGQTARNWYYMTAASNGDVYAAVVGDNIYKQTGGIGNFISLAQTARSWQGITAAPNGDVYASVSSGDIYIQTGGTANLNGGALVLQSGTGKGTGTSIINFNTATPTVSGTALQTASTKMTILGNGNVGIGTTSPSAILDVSSTTSAFLPPRMTTAQRDLIIPVAGMVIYNTTTNKHQGHNGTTWNDFY